MRTSWHILGASVTGTSHVRAGRGGDDAHTYRILGDEIVLLAAADGAGSAPMSALGASTAVQEVLMSAERRLLAHKGKQDQQNQPTTREQWSMFLVSMLQDIHNKLETLVQMRVPTSPLPSGSNTASLSLPDLTPLDSSFFSEVQEAQRTPDSPRSLRDIATTLLFAIVTPSWLVSAQVGDGGIVIQHVDGRVVSLTPPTQQEHLDETDFVTDDTYLQHAVYTVQERKDIRGIALLTDGLQMLAMGFPDNHAHAPFFMPLFNFAVKADAREEDLQRFLASERICARTDDDKTLVLAVYQ